MAAADIGPAAGKFDAEDELASLVVEADLTTGERSRRHHGSHRWPR